MAVGSKKGEFTFGNNARIVFIAGEALSYEDRVTLQADGKTVLKDPDGEYQVFFPKSVASGKQVEVLEIIAKGGSGGSGSSDSDWLNNADDSSPASINDPIYRVGPVSIGTKDSDEAIKIVADDVGLQNESNIVIDQYSNNNGRAGAYILRRSRGSEAVPEPVLAGNNLGVFQFRGWRGDNWQTAGVLQCNPVNDWIDGDASSRNSQFIFRIADRGSVRTRVTVNPDGMIIDNENANESGLTFAQLNSSSPATANAALLGVDANGKVVVAENRQKYRGELSAATDSLPTVDVQVGDHWFITDEGSNFGNIEGVNTLSRGDLLFYLNLEGDNDPSNPQNWQGIQQNTNDAFTGFVSLEDIPQVVNLVANTPLTINALVLATGGVRHVTVTDSTGVVITSGISIIISGTQVTLESNVNLNGIVVYMSGVA
jgi:hypothetical protein